VYPVPVVIKFNVVTTPAAIVAVAVAPVPAPVISTWGASVYPLPPETWVKWDTNEVVIWAVATACDPDNFWDVIDAPVAGLPRSDETVYVNVFVAAPEIIKLPLNPDSFDPSIITLSPFK